MCRPFPPKLQKKLPNQRVYMFQKNIANLCSFFDWQVLCDLALFYMAQQWAGTENRPEKWTSGHGHVNYLCTNFVWRKLGRLERLVNLLGQLRVRSTISVSFLWQPQSNTRRKSLRRFGHRLSVWDARLWWRRMSSRKVAFWVGFSQSSHLKVHLYSS